MHSVADHPEVIREYIANECSEGRILGPFDPNLLPEVQISRFSVIPKRNSSSCMEADIRPVLTRRLERKRWDRLRPMLTVLCQY